MKTKLLVVLISLLGVSYAYAADHLDAPALDGLGQLDVNDLYAFQSPNDPNSSVLIMTVNPFAGVVSPDDFATDVDYEFNIDNDGDAMSDLTFRTTFAGSGSSQTLSLTRGADTLGSGNVGQSVAVAGGGMVYAGVFDDPFFFDLNGFNDGLNFTGDDTLAGANVSAIVLEVPNSSLGGPDIGVWARTVQGGNQVDRIGRPAINTALLASDRKDAFNAGSPATDFDTFGAEVNAAIMGLSDQANADALTPILLPDILTFNTSSADGFLNGRQLADDVIDAELTLLTASDPPIGDGVDMNDVAFQTSFPYLGEAHVIPEPSSGMIALIGAVSLMLGFRRRRN